MGETPEALRAERPIELVTGEKALPTDLIRVMKAVDVLYNEDPLSLLMLAHGDLSSHPEMEESLEEVGVKMGEGGRVDEADMRIVMAMVKVDGDLGVNLVLPVTMRQLKSLARREGR